MFKKKQNTMIDQLKNSIMEGEFHDAKELFHKIPQESLEEILVEIAYDTENIAVYLFTEYMIFEEETAFLHGVASTLMTTSFVDKPGSYYVAYQHMQKAVKLAPEDYTYKEGLLLFYHIPDQLLSEELAIETANEILRICPDNSSAKSILDK